MSRFGDYYTGNMSKVFQQFLCTGLPEAAVFIMDRFDDTIHDKGRETLAARTIAFVVEINFKTDSLGEVQGAVADHHDLVANFL